MFAAHFLVFTYCYLPSIAFSLSRAVKMRLFTVPGGRSSNNDISSYL